MSWSSRARGLSTAKTRLPHGIAAKRYVLHQYQDMARTRGLAWALTDDEFSELTQRTCHYCGRQPASISGYVKRYPESGGFIYNGVDRLDNRLGYAVDNCVPCCGLCNRMKMALGVDEFLVHVAMIAHLHPRAIEAPIF